MKLSKEELRMVIYDFNSISSRLMRVNYQEYNSILAKFLSYIDEEKLIAEFIKDCGEPIIDVEAEINRVLGGYNRFLLELGDNTQAEVTNVYHILKYCLEKEIDIPSTLAMSYASSNKYQDMADGFNKRVVFVLISHIQNYLTKIGIKMGIDEHTKYSITVNNGQINVATDNATIYANQQIGLDNEKLEAIIAALREEAKSKLLPEYAETATDCLDVIETEMKSPVPKKGILKVALDGLKVFKAVVEAAATVAALVQLLEPFLS